MDVAPRLRSRRLGFGLALHPTGAAAPHQPCWRRPPMLTTVSRRPLRSASSLQVGGPEPQGDWTEAAGFDIYVVPDYTDVALRAGEPCQEELGHHSPGFNCHPRGAAREPQAASRRTFERRRADTPRNCRSVDADKRQQHYAGDICSRQIEGCPRSEPSSDIVASQAINARNAGPLVRDVGSADLTDATPASSWAGSRWARSSRPSSVRDDLGQAASSGSLD